MTLLQNSGIEVEVSKPVFAYRETIRFAPEETALAKSENKHNRMWIKASLSSNDVVEAIKSLNLLKESHCLCSMIFKASQFIRFF
mmetsp:Transcript_3710/g.5013  ORF Transcript_3710/g.5013 Transcript_3710/m.5013 type:complete len:85 (-) Transcript_3710:314-568(-)